MTIQMSVRPHDGRLAMQLERQGIPPLLAKLYAARHVNPAQPVLKQLSQLLPPAGLKDIDNAANTIADALEAGARIIIVGDYDCDGATATAVAVRGLRMMLQAMGATPDEAAWHIDFIVPNRFEYGYGLSPDIVRLAAEKEPDLLITVDNGIASVEGVAQANELGIGVVVTDHHLPGATTPEAIAIVNPNQHGCTFESKNIAGVGVMFYVLMAVRAELRERGAFTPENQPRLDNLLDLVALGTIADVVKLDANNRLLVAQGLQRIRNGRLQVGLSALFNAAGRDAHSATTMDLGFALGPRLNAAGRLSDMTIGIQTLLTDDPGHALELARSLDAMNRERQTIESSMREDALAQLGDFDPADSASIVIHNDSWHQGVIGIVASRVKEKFFRPTIAFAPGKEGQWKGSGRSIPGIHLRDVLDLVVKRLPPDSVPAFGGHAMAAGLTVNAAAMEAFIQCFEDVVREQADPAMLARRLETDGSLHVSDCHANTVDMLNEQVWGQGFPAPMFLDEFEVRGQRLLKDAHSKLQLVRGGQNFTALWWGHTEPAPARMKAAYRLERDHFTGGAAIQLVIEAGAAV